MLYNRFLLVIYFIYSRVYIGEGNGNPLQCSCLENPTDRGAWWAAVLWGRTESDTTEVILQQGIYVNLNLSIYPFSPLFPLVERICGNGKT